MRQLGLAKSGLIKEKVEGAISRRGTRKFLNQMEGETRTVPSKKPGTQQIIFKQEQL